MLICRNLPNQVGYHPGSNHTRVAAVRVSQCPLTPSQINEDYGNDKHEKAHQQQEAILGRCLWLLASPWYTHGSQAKWWAVYRELTCPLQLFLHGIYQTSFNLLSQIILHTPVILALRKLRWEGHEF